MKQISKTLKLLSDPTRLRILMVLGRKELCVCQIMGILEVSQSLVSKNLHLLYAAGFLDERKDGKLVFYSISKNLSDVHSRLINLLTDVLKGDTMAAIDMQSLDDCGEFQKKTGKCDMKSFREFMNRKRENITAKVKEKA